jgi:ribokinase
VGRIVVLGSLNMDLVVSVPKLPQPGSTVVGDRLQMFAGGKGANQAVAAARLGGDVKFVGRVGKDGLGDRLIEELKAAGVDAGGVERDPESPTGAALITVEAGGQNQITVAPGANYSVGQADVARASQLLDEGSLLVLQMEIPRQAVQHAIGEARRRGAAVLLNAAPSTGANLDTVSGVDLLVMNEHEASEILNMNVSGGMTSRRAVLRATQHGSKAAIVTMGANGAVLCDDGHVQDVPAFRVKAVDSTGAGDAFVGALAMAMSLGRELVDAARLASAAAAAAVTKQGAQSSLPTVNDLKGLFGMEMR